MQKAWDDFKNVKTVSACVVDGYRPVLMAVSPAGFVFVFKGPNNCVMDLYAFRDMAAALNDGLAKGVGIGQDGWEHYGLECGSEAAQELEQALLLASTPEAPVC